MRTLHSWFWFYIDMPRRAWMIFLGVLTPYLAVAHLVGLI